MEASAIIAALGVLLVASPAFFVLGRRTGAAAEVRRQAAARATAEETSKRIIGEAEREAETLRKSAVVAGKEEVIKLREKFEALGAQDLKGPFYRGAGCEECRGTGYRGRVGIFELLPITSELRELITQKRSNAELKAVAQRTMVTMHQDALIKAAAGVTSLEEILRVSSGDLME